MVSLQPTRWQPSRAKIREAQGKIEKLLLSYSSQLEKLSDDWKNIQNQKKEVRKLRRHNYAIAKIGIQEFDESSVSRNSVQFRTLSKDLMELGKAEEENKQRSEAVAQDAAIRAVNLVAPRAVLRSLNRLQKTAKLASNNAAYFEIGKTIWAVCESNKEDKLL